MTNVATDTATHRTCRTCGVSRPLEQFAIAGTSRRRQCKPCRVTVEIERKMMERYGMTSEGKAERLAAQGGVCLICGSDTPKHAYGWATDHCHESNEVRGILCQPCNLALGAIEALHKAGTLRVALDYAGITLAIVEES